MSTAHPHHLTDNGKEFTDRLFGLRKRAATGQHEFDALCAALKIDHRLTPPKSPRTNGMAERFNGRIEEVLQSHHFRSGEELEATLHRYVWLYNQQLPQSALDSKTPLQAMKDWHKLKPELFKKQPYYLPGCDIGRAAPADSAARGASSALARALALSRPGPARVLHHADWIAFQLSGRMVSDANNALKTGYDPVAAA